MLDAIDALLAELVAFLAAHRLAHVGEVLCDYLFNWQVYVLGALPALALEKIFPLEKRSRLSPNVLFDFTMPILDGVAWGWIVNGLGWVVVRGVLQDHPAPWALGLLDDAPIGVQAPAAYLVATLAAYVAHRLLHAVPWLWHFHAVHHSQRVLNPFTTKRAHVIEDVFTLALASIPMSLVGGSYATWFWIPVLNGYWSFVIHANARTNLGPLRWIVVSPQAHRIHHSTDPKHYDKNFCTEIALWDYLFGTAYDVHDEYPEVTGLVDFEVPAEVSRSPRAILRTWLLLNAYPFRRIARSVRARLVARRRATS